MPKISVLPEHIASQIAAGEVIERPASVVKEFVENSIDAQATKIDIAISADCRDIRIADNGCGMEPEDAALAFQRHATSKLRSADDLWQLTSMGFRGEAIPSIASVSHMVCLTRQADSVTGSRVEYCDGILKVTETGCSPGTVMEITDLFYNVPARLGFMKKATTEFGHIQETVQALAIANPGIAFTLSRQSETVLKTSGSGDLSRAVVEAGHFTGRESLLEVRAADAHARMEVRGYIAKPLHFRGDRKGILTVVNRRPVRCPLTYKALDYAYSDLIPRGKYPLAVLDIKLDPAKVDVNIHPSKKEIKYADSNSTYITVQRSLTQALRAAPRPVPQPLLYPQGASERMLPEVRESISGGEDNQRSLSAIDAHFRLSKHGEESDTRVHQIDFVGELSTSAAVATAHVATAPGTSLDRALDDDAAAHAGNTLRSITLDTAGATLATATSAEGIVTDRVDLIQADPASFQDYQMRAADLTDCKEPCKSNQASDVRGAIEHDKVLLRQLPVDWRIAGYIHNTYIVVETAEGMELIEQHIAHERTLYERILARQLVPGRTTENLQPFLVSAPLELSPEQQSLLEANLQLLNQMGFDFKIDEDGNTAVTQIPQEISGKNYATVIQDLLDQISGADTANMRLEASKSLACQAAIKNGMPLSDSQIRQLLLDWLNTPRNDTCPHGRPVRMKYSLDKLFQIFHP